MNTLRTSNAAFLVTLISLSLACGYSSKMAAPVAGVMPAITQLSPTGTNAGAAFVLTVNGSNFSSNAVVNFNGAGQTTTFVSASQLIASIPARAVSAAGTAAVSVTNPATTGTGMYGSGGTMPETSSPMNFTVN
jgi:hypothetical protein